MIITIDNDRLHFKASGNETNEERSFLNIIDQYVVLLNGASTLVVDNEGDLVLHINSFDNTLLVCKAAGEKLANFFGAKRFLIGELRNKAIENATQYPRDLTFPLKTKEIDATPCRYKNLPDMLQQFRSDKDKFYNILAELFNRCADFTAGKQEEYLTGGKKEDKYCRFNPDATDSFTTTTENVFILNRDDNLIGTLSATIINHPNREIDIYFYDEVVDYFTLLSNDEKALLEEKTRQLNAETNPAAKEAIKSDIAAIIEPKRTELLGTLFAAARKNLRNAIPNLDAKIEAGLVHAFIRATAGRPDSVAQFARLGCSATNVTQYVIHGPATALLKMLDVHVKTLAAEQLKKLQPAPSSLSLLSTRSATTTTASSTVEPAATIAPR